MLFVERGLGAFDVGCVGVLLCGETKAGAVGVGFAGVLLFEETGAGVVEVGCVWLLLFEETGPNTLEVVFAGPPLPCAEVAPDGFSIAQIWLTRF